MSAAADTVALVLAAGAGSRLGGLPKCLIRLGGQTLLQRQLGALADIGVRDVRLVVGRHAEAIAAHLASLPEGLRPRLLHNPSPADDPADSLRLGLQSLTALPDRLLVLVSDLPLLGAAALGAALAAFDARGRGQHALVPVVGGNPGHPAVLDAHAIALLRQREGGLRAWRRDQPGAVCLWPSEDPAHVRDLDTPADLEALAAGTGLPVTLPAPLPGPGKA